MEIIAKAKELRTASLFNCRVLFPVQCRLLYIGPSGCPLYDPVDFDDIGDIITNPVNEIGLMR
jgi:hypothetical protein